VTSILRAIERPAISQRLRQRAEFAESLIREAGALALSFYRQRDRLTRQIKGHQDLVTIADQAVEALIRRRLSEAFPEDGFLGEESGGTPTASFWSVDPIDGTGNFLRGIPVWGVSVGYVEDGEPSLGLIYFPVEDRLYKGIRGGGATRDGHPIAASTATDVSDTLLCLGSSLRAGPKPTLAFLETALQSKSSLRYLGACIGGLALVAEGSAEAYYEAHSNTWDCLAGIVIAREAGCRVNSFPGTGDYAKGGPILVAAPGIYDALAAIDGIVL
jgi:myo-inositol-1(or 4)-monophosphatase